MAQRFNWLALIDATRNSGWSLSCNSRVPDLKLGQPDDPAVQLEEPCWGEP